MRRRVTKTTRLSTWDEVLWCEHLIAGKACFDKHTDTMQPDTPVRMRRGVVLHVTEKAVLLYVGGNTPGLSHCRHWVPKVRVWAVTGESRKVPGAKQAPWSDEAQSFYEERARKRMDEVWDAA